MKLARWFFILLLVVASFGVLKEGVHAQSAGSLPDLYIDDVVYIDDGSALRGVGVRYCNAGGGLTASDMSANIVIHLAYSGGSFDYGIGGNNLTAWAPPRGTCLTSKPITYSTSFGGDSSVDFTATIDYGSRINESVESNNTVARTVSFGVQAVNGLRVSSLTARSEDASRSYSERYRTIYTSFSVPVQNITYTVYSSNNTTDAFWSGVRSGVSTMNSTMTIDKSLPPNSCFIYIAKGADNSGRSAEDEGYFCTTNYATSPLPVISFSGPTSMERGTSARIAWTAYNSTSCLSYAHYLNSDNTYEYLPNDPWTASSRALSGEAMVFPTRSVVYTLKCFNSDGKSTLTTVRIQVIEPKPISPLVVYVTLQKIDPLGQASEKYRAYTIGFNYAVREFTISLYENGGSVLYTSLRKPGGPISTSYYINSDDFAKALNPNKLYRYEVVATRYDTGEIARYENTFLTSNFTPSLIQPSTGPLSIGFTTDASSLVRGASARLVWDAKNAKTCDSYVFYKNAQGAYERASDSSWNGIRSISGSTFVTPKKSTTYYLSCIDFDGKNAVTFIDIAVTEPLSGGTTSYPTQPSTAPIAVQQIGTADVRYPDLEKKARTNFIKVYNRVASPKDYSDKLAIDIMVYGLDKTTVQSQSKELWAISTFQLVFQRIPKSGDDWEIVHAIAYSGASKKKDRDNDLLSDDDEAVFGSNPRVKDSDRDGYNDGDEVNNGYSPSKGNRAKLD